MPCCDAPTPAISIFFECGNEHRQFNRCGLSNLPAGGYAVVSSIPRHPRADIPATCSRLGDVLVSRRTVEMKQTVVTDLEQQLHAGSAMSARTRPAGNIGDDIIEEATGSLSRRSPHAERAERTAAAVRHRLMSAVLLAIRQTGSRRHDQSIAVNRSAGRLIPMLIGPSVDRADHRSSQSAPACRQDLPARQTSSFADRSVQDQSARPWRREFAARHAISLPRGGGSVP